MIYIFWKTYYLRFSWNHAHIVLRPDRGRRSGPGLSGRNPAYPVWQASQRVENSGQEDHCKVSFS